MSGPSAGLDLAEYEALLRADFSGFAERAFIELIQGAGSHFDPRCVEAFLRVRAQVEALMRDS